MLSKLLHANIQLFLYRTCVLNSEHLKEVPTLPHPGTFFSLHGRGGIKDGSKRELSRVHCPRLSWYFHQKPRGIVYQGETSLLFMFKEENAEGMFENI